MTPSRIGLLLFEVTHRYGFKDTGNFVRTTELRSFFAGALVGSKSGTFALQL